jgi:hypothetical protein
MRRESFFLPGFGYQDRHYDHRVGETHGFEILRTSLDLALPIAPDLSSASALSWWSILLL